MPEGPEVAKLTDYLQMIVMKQVVSVKITGGPYEDSDLERYEKIRHGFEALSKTISSEKVYVSLVKKKGKKIFITLELVRDGKKMSKVIIAHMGESGCLMVVDEKGKLIDSARSTTAIVSNSAKDAGNKYLFGISEVPMDRISDTNLLIDKHTHYIFELVGSMSSKSYLIYNDPRKRGTLIIVTPKQASEKLLELGTDVMTEGFTRQRFEEILESVPTNSAIGKVLHEQDRLSGIGNYLRAEILHASRIHPLSTVGAILKDPGYVDLLYYNIKKITDESYKDVNFKCYIYRKSDHYIDDKTQKIYFDPESQVWLK